MPKFVLPKCRHCGSSWRPAKGVVATQAYCLQCRDSRREIAKKEFDLRPIEPSDIAGPYLLPRAR